LGDCRIQGYDKELATKGKTPEATLGAMLYVDVRDNPNSLFAGLGARPKRLALKSLRESDIKKFLDTLMT
jgi:hypothetical protein